ncbi:hypothetical protein HY604_00915 [Candidatus Peregrinibacteria bacterium]|nr:hypothetical protein [Candidatus Peregrinibacteria bacterium]
MKNKFAKIIFLSLLLLSISTATAYAYEIDKNFRPVNLPFGLDYKENTAETNTVIILQILAGGLLYFASPVAIILIGIAAITMIVGGAETDKVDQAKKNLTWTIIGLLVIIMSYSIVRAVLSYVIKAAEPGVVEGIQTNPDGIETDTPEDLQPDNQKPPTEMAV